MSIFPLDIMRFPALLTIYLVRWKRDDNQSTLENLSDETLEDIGLEPSKPDFDAVKPFWMP